MTNPIHNAIVAITKRQLKTCNRCGCPDLAWIQFKSGKWALVETATTRPMWRGQGQAPEGLWALKFNYHNCEQYKQAKTEAEYRANACHPLANEPAKILADSLHYLIAQIMQEPAKLDTLSDETHPLTKAFNILLTAQTNVPNLK